MQLSNLAFKAFLNFKKIFKKPLDMLTESFLNILFLFKNLSYVLKKTEKFPLFIA